MFRLIYKIPFGILILSLTGCITAHFAPAVLNQVYPVRTPPEKIELFRTQLPDKKYIEIGSVNSRPAIAAVNEQINSLRAKASEAGGDAIIALDVSATVGATATVIRYQP